MKNFNKPKTIKPDASQANSTKPMSILKWIDHNTGAPVKSDQHYAKVEADAKAEYQKKHPKIVDGQIGNVKYVGNRNIGHESWDQKLKIDKETKQHVMKEEYESNKYKRPMSSSGTILREIISDNAKAEIAKLKSTKPISIDFSNDLRELEAYQQSRIEANDRARRLTEQIKKRDDSHRGLATIINFKK